VALALIVPSVSVWSSRGWLWRFPPEVAKQLSFKVDTFHKYVWKELDRRATPFANDGKPKLLIVGDSQAGDLVNLLVAAGIADRTDLRTIPIRHDCKPVVPNNIAVYRINVPAYASQCELQLKAMETSERLKDADIIVLASNWSNWAIDLIPQTVAFLDRDRHREVFVLGNKMQSMTGVQFLANFGIRPHSDAIKIEPHADAISANKQIAALKGDFHFLNPLDLFCNRDGCSIVSNSGVLILYDSLHLTPGGVQYLAPRLLEMWGDGLTHPSTG
jgi:hypothetical protein